MVGGGGGGGGGGDWESGEPVLSGCGALGRKQPVCFADCNALLSCGCAETLWHCG